MKKTFFTFALFAVSFASIANNSVIVINEEFKQKILDDTELEQECWATCTATVTNTETGETFTVTSIGHSYVNCDMAATDCKYNATKRAKQQIAQLEP